MPAGAGTVTERPRGASAPAARPPATYSSPRLMAEPEPSAASTSSTRSYHAPVAARLPALRAVQETASGAPTLTVAGALTAATTRSGAPTSTGPAATDTLSDSPAPSFT